MIMRCNPSIRAAKILSSIDICFMQGKVGAEVTAIILAPKLNSRINGWICPKTKTLDYLLFLAILAGFP